MYTNNLLDMCFSNHELNTHSILSRKTQKNSPEENLRKPQSRSERVILVFGENQLHIEIRILNLARARTLTRVISISGFARATKRSLERTKNSFRFLCRRSPSLEPHMLCSSAPSSLSGFS